MHSTFFKQQAIVFKHKVYWLIEMYSMETGPSAHWVHTLLHFSINLLLTAAN